jgi:adenine phosphoribosyltransferase
MNSPLEQNLKQIIRDIPDYPQKGILFKDLTPILKQPILCQAITQALVEPVKSLQIDVVAGIESRGFWFGMLIAQALQVPFVPIRKKGKLPHATVALDYSLEYGTATIEIHRDAIHEGQNVLIHDDLLATGGTAAASADLVKKLNGKVAAFSFVAQLGFLHGKQKLENYSPNVFSLCNY